jgi:hypothetical protein
MIDDPPPVRSGAVALRLRAPARRRLLEGALRTLAGAGLGAVAAVRAPNAAARMPANPGFAGASQAQAPAVIAPAAAGLPGVAGLATFAGAAPGAPLPAPWREQTLRGIRANRHALVEDEGRTVVQIESDASASSLLHPVAGPDARAVRLRWRWKTSAYPLDRWLGEKRGDDYAARVYVLYDYPLDRLPIGQRMLLGAARTLHDPELPAAALCYLLDPRAAQDTLLESPYSSRVRMIVVRSTRTTGRWWAEDRDLRADFARAFGTEYGPGVAPIRAIVIAADTDQSGATLTTRFGDLTLEMG